MFKSFLYALSELFVCLFIFTKLYVLLIYNSFQYAVLVWFGLLCFCFVCFLCFSREGVRGGLPVFEPSVVFN